jgi:hypothetical protein
VTPHLQVIPPNLFNPRRVRVVKGIMRCMKCEEALYRTTIQAGWAFQTCEHKRCDAEFWSLALPPDSFGGYLAALVGEQMAETIIRKAWLNESKGLQLHELWGLMLNEGDEGAWIQVAVRPRERHLHRRTPIRQFLKALSIL